MKKYLLLLSLSFFVGIAFAHSDLGILQTFGRVRSCFTTGYPFEERQKGVIISQLVNMLSDEMNNKDTIVLDMSHQYTSHNLKSKYYVGYELDENKREVLNVMAFSCKFDAPEILKLVEYAIKNKNKIKKIQKITPVRISYSWTVNHLSISDTLVDEILLTPVSDCISKLLSVRMNRPIKEGNVSYYFQNNKYHIILREENTKERELIILDNLFQLAEVDGSRRTFLFDTDSSFYYIGTKTGTSGISLSKRHLFDQKGSFKTYSVTYLGRDFIGITMTMFNAPGVVRRKYGQITSRWWSSGRDSFMIYAADDDMLVEGVDDIIDAINIDILKKMGYYNEPRVIVEFPLKDSI